MTATKSMNPQPSTVEALAQGLGSLTAMLVEMR